MTSIKTILHPTDFSECADNAFQIAGALARQLGARLIVLHVVPPPIVVYSNGIVTEPPQVHLAQKRAKLEHRRPTDPSAPVEHLLLEGDPIDEIVQTSSTADLIVMGTHGWTSWSRHLLGSVAEGVSRLAACPVLTLRSDSTSALAMPQSQIASTATHFANA